jgi:tripartite-type tricarboxylate transporter receptor subunit TctC
MGGLARAQAAHPAAYPDRPIRFIVPFPPGGGTDVWARMVAEGLQTELGQPILIENRGGGGGMVGTEAAAKAPADGYNLLYNITTHVQAPVTFRRFPYDPVADFFPIGRLGTTAITFCVGPSVPPEVRDLAGFVAWGRGRPLAFGNYGQGSTGHAFAVLLAEEAKLQVTQVAYRGEAPMLQDLLGGQVQMAFGSLVAARPHIETGRFKALAVTGTERIRALPDVPTLVEQGLTDAVYRMNPGWIGIIAPRQTPVAIQQRMAAEIMAVTQLPEVREQIVGMGFTPVGGTPDAFAAAYRAEFPLWRQLIEQAGLKAQS